MASDPQQQTRSILLSAIQLVVILSSLSLACIAGFYVHPFLFFIAQLTESMLQQWFVLQTWLTAPFLFVLVNVVVGALYFTSRMEPQGKRQPDGTSMSEMVADGHDPDVPDVKSQGKSPEVESSKPGKPFVRLVRSKPDRIAPRNRRMEYAASRLKKSGTFESTSHSAAVVKPVVVVADPPEDDQPPAGSEEVDKKAEDFIGRFYQKMKLQRLDALLRYQESLQQGSAK